MLLDHIAGRIRREHDVARLQRLLELKPEFTSIRGGATPQALGEGAPVGRDADARQRGRGGRGNGAANSFHRGRNDLHEAREGDEGFRIRRTDPPSKAQASLRSPRPLAETRAVYAAAPDTIAALATPSGESAIGVVRISGPKAAELATSLFGRPLPPRLARHADYRDRGGKVVDDVLVTFFPQPKSYTGEDTLEISFHGNPFVLQRVMEDLHGRGCRAAEPGEFTRRAFLNGRIDLSQAEAVMDLIRARSDRALEAANRQLRGAVGQRVAEFIARMVELTARVEAYIDFPEEDLPAEDRSWLTGTVESLLADIRRLRATARYGALLRDGVRTVIVGEPNAGKSSLLNRLLGWERALVSPEPGTTRDFLEERRIIGAHCLRFIDTAGLNEAPAPLEKLGIDRTLERARDADLLLFVLDTSSTHHVVPKSLTELITPRNTLIVWNKVDLAQEPPVLSQLAPFRQVRVSAKTGAGIEELERALTEVIEHSNTDFEGEVVAINARHATDLDEAHQCLEGALGKLRTGQADELMASDLRGALDALGRIGGRVDHEQILDALFAKFCIGK